jgi:hypothetical protein
MPKFGCSFTGEICNDVHRNRELQLSDQGVNGCLYRDLLSDRYVDGWLTKVLSTLTCLPEAWRRCDVAGARTRTDQLRR